MKYIRVGTYTFPLNKPFHIVHRNDEDKESEDFDVKRVYQNFYFLTDRKMLPLWSFFFSTGTIYRMHGNNRKKIKELVIQAAHLKIKKIITNFLCGEKSTLNLKNILYSLEKNWLEEFVKELGKESREFQNIERIKVNIYNGNPPKEIIQHLEKTYLDENGKFLESEYRNRSRLKEEVTEDMTVTNPSPPNLKLVSNG